MGGGGSHHETHYNYVDRTMEIMREAQRRAEEQLAAERRRMEQEELQRIERERQELVERERQRFLEEQERIKQAEEKRRREENERKERERRRLKALQDKASSLRNSLRAYRLGSITGSQIVKNLNFSKLRIGVFGPTGSGKSCFINTCERTVRQTDKGSVPIATSGAEGTILLEDYLTEMFFRLVDTRGFFSYDHQEGKEMNDILYGRIKSGDFIKRGENSLGKETLTRKDAPFEEWLHGVILVLKANDIRLKNGSQEKYLKPVRDILKNRGMSPITVVTHKDTLNSDCNQAIKCASEATGSSPDHTFFVANYCPSNPGPDVNTELQIFEILQCALKVSEKYIENAKEKKHVKIEEELIKALYCSEKQKPDSIVPHAPINLFLTIMNAKYDWSNVDGIDLLTLTNMLTEQDITSLGILASCWIEISTILPFCVANAVEADLRNMLMI